MAGDSFLKSERWPSHDPEASGQQPSVPQTRPLWRPPKRSQSRHGRIWGVPGGGDPSSQSSQEERPTLCLHDAVPDVRRPGQVAGDLDTEKFERVYLLHLETVYYQLWDWRLFNADIDHYLLSFRHVQFESLAEKNFFLSIILVRNRGVFLDLSDRVLSYGSPIAYLIFSIPRYAKIILFHRSKHKISDRASTAILSVTSTDESTSKISFKFPVYDIDRPNYTHFLREILTPLTLLHPWACSWAGMFCRYKATIARSPFLNSVP